MNNRNDRIARNILFLKRKLRGKFWVYPIHVRKESVEISAFNSGLPLASLIAAFGFPSLQPPAP